jgi:hypothetical protein
MSTIPTPVVTKITKRRLRATIRRLEAAIEYLEFLKLTDRPYLEELKRALADVRLQLEAAS